MGSVQGRKSRHENFGAKEQASSQRNYLKHLNNYIFFNILYKIQGTRTPYSSMGENYKNILVEIMFI